MKVKRTLRLISLVMLLSAIVFVICALANPTLGNTIYIGNFVFGYEQWVFCYIAYIVVMIALFAASFLIKGKK